MGDVAVRTEGLTKRFGEVVALDDLDFEGRAGGGGRLPRAGSAPARRTTIRLMLGLAQPSAGRCEIFGLDSQAGAVEAHRHLAYVGGKPTSGLR